MLTEKDIFIGAKFDVLTYNRKNDKYPFTWDLSIGDEKERFTSVKISTSYATNSVVWDNHRLGKLVYVVREDHPTTGQYVPMECLQPIGPVIQSDGQYSFLSML